MHTVRKNHTAMSELRGTQHIVLRAVHALRYCKKHVVSFLIFENYVFRTTATWDRI